MFSSFIFIFSGRIDRLMTHENHLFLVSFLSVTLSDLDDCRRWYVNWLLFALIILFWRVILLL